MDPDRAIALAREDIDGGVGRWLPASAELQVELSGQVGDSAFTAVRWVHRGTNTGTDDPFLGLAPTGDEVEVHGITLVEDRGDGEPVFHRFVDWVGVFDQLGMAVGGRLTVSEHPGHIGQPATEG